MSVVQVLFHLGDQHRLESSFVLGVVSKLLQSWALSRKGPVPIWWQCEAVRLLRFHRGSSKGASLCNEGREHRLWIKGWSREEWNLVNILLFDFLLPQHLLLITWELNLELPLPMK